LVKTERSWAGPGIAGDSEKRLDHVTDIWRQTAASRNTYDGLPLRYKCICLLFTLFVSLVVVLIVVVVVVAFYHNHP